jgi:isopenicillin N synthase-like dioxygenase
VWTDFPSALRESFLMGDDICGSVQWQGPVPEDYKAQNNWPSAQPEFKEALDLYYSTMMPFARSVLPLFALALGLEETALDHLHKFPMGALRCLQYPSQESNSSEDTPGFLAHTDYTCKLVTSHP